MVWNRPFISDCLETFNSIDMKLSCTGWADNSNEKSHKMHCINCQAIYILSLYNGSRLP